MSREKPTKKKALGIAGKDVVAAALAAAGSQRILAGDYYVGIACVVLAIGLYLIQQFL